MNVKRLKIAVYFGIGQLPQVLTLKSLRSLPSDNRPCMVLSLEYPFKTAESDFFYTSVT